jgi:tetratricopeptide (TPR) repeat protein
MAGLRLKISIPILLVLIICAQISFLVCILYLPAADWFDNLDKNKTIEAVWATPLRKFVNSFYYGTKSLEYARAVKDSAQASGNRAKSIADLRTALAIQQRYYNDKISLPAQSYLDAMEVIDTSGMLADKLIESGNPQEAEQLLSRASELVKEKSLPELFDTIEKYAKVLRKNGKDHQAEQAEKSVLGMKAELTSRFDDYQQTLGMGRQQDVPSQIRHHQALFYFASYLSIVAKDLLLYDRLAEAEKYAARCVVVARKLPEVPRITTDLATLALIYTEEKKYQDAAKTYDDCIKQLQSSEMPDALFLLPQYDSYTDVLQILKKPEAATYKQLADNVFAFLFSLRDDHPRTESSFQFTKGSLVEVARGDQIFSGTVEKVLGGDKYTVRLIGLMPPQNVVTVTKSQLTLHTEYGTTNP